LGRNSRALRRELIKSRFALQRFGVSRKRGKKENQIGMKESGNLEFLGGEEKSKEVGSPSLAVQH